MSYNTISRMAGDGDLHQRFVACAAQENIDHPQSWVQQNIWQLVTAPGLADSYQYAVDTNKRDPGQLEDVISDAVILSVVQALAAELAAP